MSTKVPRQMPQLPQAWHSYKTSNDSDFGAAFASLYTKEQMADYASLWVAETAFQMQQEIDGLRTHVRKLQEAEAAAKRTELDLRGANKSLKAQVQMIEKMLADSQQQVWVLQCGIMGVLHGGLFEDGGFRMDDGIKDYYDKDCTPGDIVRGWKLTLEKTISEGSK